MYVDGDETGIQLEALGIGCAEISTIPERPGKVQARARIAIILQLAYCSGTALRKASPKSEHSSVQSGFLWSMPWCSLWRSAAEGAFDAFGDRKSVV